MNYRKLEDMGINVIVIWGCEIKEMAKDYEKEKELIRTLIFAIKEG